MANKWRLKVEITVGKLACNAGKYFVLAVKSSAMKSVEGEVILAEKHSFNNLLAIGAKALD